jgi:NTP pyrophosphatase (non-canonical NTP hydrolase)
MINLNQLTEDSYNSASRRNPNLNYEEQLRQIFLEECELADAYISEPKMSEHCPELMDIEEELADIILACLVFARGENIDIEKALRIKNEFNKTRQ